MKKLHLIWLLILVVFFTACSDDDNPVNVDPLEDIRGVYVLNEGVYGNNNSSLSYFNFESSEARQNIFSDGNNGKLLGDTGNDMYVFGQVAYIVVSTSNKIEVLNLSTGENIGTVQLSGKTPRQVVVVNADRAFVTCSASNAVFEFNPASLQITDSVYCGLAPDAIEYLNGKLFVADNGWGSGRTISVINTNNLTLEKTLVVGYNPVSLASDGSEYVYAVCVGGWNAGESRKGIYKINSASLSIVDSLSTVSFPSFPGEVCVSENSLYVVDGAGVNEISLTGFQPGNLIIPTSAVVSGDNQWATIYGIAYDFNEKKIYCGNPKDFSQNGDISVFNRAGEFLEKFDCGINPGTIVIVNP